MGWGEDAHKFVPTLFGEIHILIALPAKERLLISRAARRRM